jgi:hypothetical protein
MTATEYHQRNQERIALTDWGKLHADVYHVLRTSLTAAASKQPGDALSSFELAALSAAIDCAHGRHAGELLEDAQRRVHAAVQMLARWDILLLDELNQRCVTCGGVLSGADKLAGYEHQACAAVAEAERAIANA